MAEQTLGTLNLLCSESIDSLGLDSNPTTAYVLDAGFINYSPKTTNEKNLVDLDKENHMVGAETDFKAPASKKFKRKSVTKYIPARPSRTKKQRREIYGDVPTVTKLAALLKTISQASKGGEKSYFFEVDHSGVACSLPILSDGVVGYQDYIDIASEYYLMHVNNLSRDLGDCISDITVEFKLDGFEKPLSGLVIFLDNNMDKEGALKNVVVTNYLLGYCVGKTSTSSFQKIIDVLPCMERCIIMLRSLIPIRLESVKNCIKDFKPPSCIRVVRISVNGLMEDVSVPQVWRGCADSTPVEKLYMILHMYIKCDKNYKESKDFTYSPDAMLVNEEHGIYAFYTKADRIFRVTENTTPKPSACRSFFVVDGLMSSLRDIVIPTDNSILLFRICGNIIMDLRVDDIKTILTYSNKTPGGNY